MKLGNWNGPQRCVLLAMAIVGLGLLVAHNPAAGYHTSITFFDPWPLPGAGSAISPVGSACEPLSAEQRALLDSQMSYLGGEVARCRTEPLAFLHWRSIGALSSHVVTIRRLLVFAGITLVTGVIWLWVFHSPGMPRDIASGRASERDGKRASSARASDGHPLTPSPPPSSLSP